MADEELIDGVYKLVMCIATGGSSQVWEVVEQPSGRHLAMKLLKMDVPDFKENKTNLKYESEVLKSLDHPMIIKFDKYSSSRDNTYMTMEHFRAANVKLQIKADINSVHVRARRLFEGVCGALSHVHSKGWIHRDLKPDNVLMNKVGEIRLVDFSLSSKEVKGFAKMIGGGKLKTIQGTRTYIAPETIRKEAPTFQTDLYSLGIMFFEVLCGKTPFQAPTPEELLTKHLRAEPPFASQFNPNVTPEMDRLITRLLKKKTKDRPASVDEVLGELKRIKIFKEDVTEDSLAKKAADEKGDAMSQLTDIRLDSRADVKLREMLAANPELARQYEIDKQAKADKKKALEEERRSKVLKSSTPEKASPPAAPVPQQQPMMMPQQPMMMMPPQPMMMPGAYPPGFPPGYGQMPPQQAIPGMPPTGMPPFNMPQTMQPLPPGQIPSPAPSTFVQPPLTAATPNIPQVAQQIPATMQQPAVKATQATAANPATVNQNTSPKLASPSVVPPQQKLPSSSAVVSPPANPKPSPVPSATTNAVQKEPNKASQSAATANPDELEFMTELPDVL